MSSFPTPATYRDNYTDATRPNGTTVFMLLGGQFVTVYWSHGLQQWSTVPTVQVVAATPFGSPQIMTSTPMQSQQASSPNPGARGPTAFPQLVRFAVPQPTYTAKFVLELPPEMSLLQYSGIVYNSSDSNNYYGPVGPLTYWELPADLCGYSELQGLYHYVPPNPLAAGITEGDTVLAAMNAFFQPVDMVVHRNCRG
jgi:hypothetical protein